MKIADLPLPVAAVKSNWVPATTSFDFTPRDGSTQARAACQSAVARQAHNAYVIEYIVQNIEKPNPGFEHDPEYLRDVERHARLAGRLVAVHRIRQSPRPLKEIIGDAAYERLQNVWARGGKRYRWSVAFPAIESYDITPPPPARDVFGPEPYRRLFEHQSGTLRSLQDNERSSLADLLLQQSDASNAWVGIEDEAKIAAGNQIDPGIARDIDLDLAGAAMEGLTEAQKAQVRQRAKWLAQRFIRERQKANTLFCDDCGFNPATRTEGTKVRPRSLLDVHHIHPLYEGKRYTTIRDFQLLCPICHRFAHAIMNEG